MQTWLRMEDLEDEVASLQRENTALRRCLAKRVGRGWEEAAAAEKHRVACEERFANCDFTEVSFRKL